MFKRQYNILVSFLGESKQGCYQNGVEQYQFCCPCCADENGGKIDGKYNLEINFGIGKYHCWKCDIKGNLYRLIKRYAGSEIANEYLEDVKLVLSTNLYRLQDYEELTKTIVSEEIKLPKTFTKITDYKKLPIKLQKFLSNRKLTQDIIDKYNIGYTKWDGEDIITRSRLIIPSYDKNGNLNYWVGRDFTGYERQKYLNVKSDRSKIIFNENMIEWDGDIILVEGIIDSILLPNCIPLMGKILLKDSLLYEKLTKKANGNIYICLDNDTTIDETKKIYKLLNNGRLKNKIKYVVLDKYKDFGEIYENEGRLGIINTLIQSQQFTEFELNI